MGDLDDDFIDNVGFGLGDWDRVDGGERGGRKVGVLVELGSVGYWGCDKTRNRLIVYDTVQR